MTPTTQVRYHVGAPATRAGAAGVSEGRLEPNHSVFLTFLVSGAYRLMATQQMVRAWPRLFRAWVLAEPLDVEADHFWLCLTEFLALKSQPE
jgi:hypothetical protein